MNPFQPGARAGAGMPMPPDATPPHSVRSDHATLRLSDRRLVLLLAAFSAVAPLSVDTYLPALPAIAAALGTGSGRVQLTLSAFFIGFACGMLFYGPLSDRFGRRPFLIGGLTLYATASALCVVASAVEQLVVLRFLQALGGSAAAVLARAIVRDVYRPGEVARMLSLMGMVSALAPLLAPTIGGQILAWLDWRAVFVLLTLFGVACLAAAIAFLPETFAPERRTAASIGEALIAYGHILLDRPSLGILVCGGCAFAGMFAYITTIPFVYIAHFGVPPRFFGLLFGLNIAAIMTAAAINSRLVSRHGTGRMLWWGAGIAAGAGAALALTTASGIGGIYGVIVPLFFYVGTLGLIGANCNAELMLRFPGNAGAAAALFGAAQFGIGTLASLAASALAGHGAAAMGAIIALFGALALAGRFLMAAAQTSRRQ